MVNHLDNKISQQKDFKTLLSEIKKQVSCLVDYKSAAGLPHDSLLHIQTALSDPDPFVVYDAAFLGNVLIKHEYENFH